LADTQDIVAGMMDTPNREYNSAAECRWLSPDPAGAGWNQYAYATNPNSMIDPTGLDEQPQSPCAGTGNCELANDHISPLMDRFFTPDSTKYGTDGRPAPWLLSNSEGAKNTSSSDDSSGNGSIPEIVGQSVRRGHKWYNFIKHWFDNRVEADKLNDELNTDQTIQKMATEVITRGDANRTPQFIEIYSLEATNLNYDEARMIGKVMAEVPNLPGTDKFGDFVFDYYGGKRDENNRRIDELLQEAAQSVVPQ
jgi:uncharacterized protein RhaS with RHS repeats